MRYFVDMYNGKMNYISNIDFETCNQVSKAEDNTQEVLELYSLGTCVRDALDQLIEWSQKADNSGNYMMRNLHTAERMCRGFLFEFRTCLDHIETEIKRRYGESSELWSVFKEGVSNAYDTCAEYAFTYQLRNCSQHCKNIVHGFNGDARIGISSNAKKLLDEYKKWKSTEKQYICDAGTDIDLLKTFSKAFLALNEALAPVIQYLLDRNNVCNDIRYLREWGDSLSKQYNHDVHSFHIFDIKFNDGREATIADMTAENIIIYAYPFDWDMIYELSNSLTIRKESLETIEI